ncbi:hypothetical protein C7Y72_19280 [Paraconexibacter algicola]|uniref:Uncharacterized protein n=2 Tax=Paraconexibacter algicola TaxID=2133960 RepID=A0A2T4UE50_9ACTN|nr:hypothetical protein C7Y72_19280 [Paraconexibacter algicola]
MCGSCGECKRCKRAAYMRSWYATKTPEQRRAMVANRDPEKVAAQAAKRGRAKRAGNESVEQRTKRLARKAVWQAVRDGRLVPQPCERSGDECSGRIEAHHDDYGRRFDVRWLCQKHHREHHNNHGQETAP